MSKKISNQKHKRTWLKQQQHSKELFNLILVTRMREAANSTAKNNLILVTRMRKAEQQLRMIFMIIPRH